MKKKNECNATLNGIWDWHKWNCRFEVVHEKAVGRQYQRVSVLPTGVFYSVCILFFKYFALVQYKPFIGIWQMVPVALHVLYWTDWLSQEKPFGCIIYNKSTRCNSGSTVFINNYKYALHVSDALCVHHQEHYKL